MKLILMVETRLLWDSCCEQQYVIFCFTLKPASQQADSTEGESRIPEKPLRYYPAFQLTNQYSDTGRKNVNMYSGSITFTGEQVCGAQSVMLKVELCTLSIFNTLELWVLLNSGKKKKSITKVISSTTTSEGFNIYNRQRIFFGHCLVVAVL